MERSPHFAKANIKFYFVQQPNELLDGTENVMQGINNVLIETLMAGRMGLPAVASPTHQVEHMEFRIPILHPCILILTKLKRWTMNRTSTRPKTKAKRDTDWADIKYLVAWLSERTYKIEFSKYEGKSRGDLLLMARQVHHELMEEEDEDLIVKLEEVMYPVDWEDMIIIVLAPTVEDLIQTEGDPRQTMEIPTPIVIVTTSSVDVLTPTANVPTPSVDVPTSTVDVPTPTVKVPTSTVDAPTSMVDALTSTMDALTSTVDALTSTVDVPTPTVGVPTPTADVPHIDSGRPTPTVENPTPTVDAPTSTVDVPTSSVEVPTSSVEVPTPTIDDPTPTPEETAA